MKAYRPRPPRRILPILALTSIAGCSAPSQPLNPTAHLAPAPQPPSHPTSDISQSRRGDPHPTSPAALLSGHPITWEDLQPSLAEAAGGQALQELVLDRLLAERMRQRNLSITAEDIAAERNLLLASVSHDAAATPAEAERLLEQVRRSRGLGEHRFDRLLERNARMRKLVAPEVTVSDDEVRQAFDMAHGPRSRARVIVVPDQRAAAQLRTQLLGIKPDEPPPPAPDHETLTFRFAQAAMKQSTDDSASRGGLLEPVSAADPAYPAAAREALARLKPGELSEVIAIDRGYALLLLEAQLPADGTTLEQSDAPIRAEVRKRRERLAMDDLARRLLREAKVSILDRNLDWSWRNSLAPRE